MTDRSIVIRLKADVANALSGMKAASAATKDFAGQSLIASAKHEQALSRIGKASLIGGALVVGAFVAAVKAAAEFDKAMSSVKANVDDKTAPSMARLSKAALLAGSTTAFSAKEAAEAENELAKAGLSAADIVGGALNASLTLASAGQIDLASSAEILSATMVQFSLHAKDAAHIADVLSAGADKSLGGVDDLGQALKYAGVASSQMGVSLDETVGVLADFASRGITGSMAGTGFRQMLVSLTAPTHFAQAALDKYGISVFDASGKFVGMRNVAGQLHDKLGGLTQAQQAAALSTIFTARAISEANILMKDGAQGVKNWTDAVNDQGFAARQAATKLNNLSGDLTKLKNSFNVALIETGQQSTGAMRGLIQALDGVTQAYDRMQPASKGFVADLAAGAGGLLLVGGAALILLPKIAALKNALAELNAASAIGKAGPFGALAAVLLIGASAAAADTASHRAKDIAAAQNDPSTLAADRARIAQLQREDAAQSRLPVRFGGTPKASNADEIKRLQAVVEGATKAEDDLGKSMADATKAGDVLVPSILKVGDSYRQAEFDLSDFVKSLDDFKSSVLGVESAQDKLTSDANTLTKAVEAQAKQFHDTGTALKGNSDEALANRSAMRGMTADAIGVIEAYAKTGKSSDQVAAKTAAVKDRFIKLAEKAGFTKAQIKEYIDQIDKVPPLIKSNLILNGVDSTLHKLATLRGGVNDYVKALQVANGVGIGVYSRGKPQKPGSPSGPGLAPAHATGTTSAPGGLSLVGERGPEWMYVQPGARIWPSGQAPSFPGPGGGPSTLVVVDVNGDLIGTMQIKAQQVTGAALSAQNRRVGVGARR